MDSDLTSTASREVRRLAEAASGAITQDQHTNLSLVSRFYYCFLTGRVEECAQFCADSFVLHESDGLPYGGTYRGKSAVLNLARRFLATWGEQSVSFLPQLTAGADRVMSRVELSATHPRTGRSWSMPIIEEFRLRDGEIVEMTTFYFDAARVAWAADFTPKYESQTGAP
jgi:uncharacterized protein